MEKNTDPNKLEQLLKIMYEADKTFKSHSNLHRSLSRKAKQKSFDDEMSKINAVKDTARMQNFFENGKSQNITTLLKPDGTCTRTTDETINCLMETHFTDCTIVKEDEDWQEVKPLPKMRSKSEIKSIYRAVALEKIMLAIESFHSWKAVAYDKIFPAIIQKSKHILAPLLVPIFRACLILSYIPSCWRSTLVTFIPKPGKDPSIPKSYRPICLTSFLLKTLEKLIDKKIRQVDLDNKNLDDSQHAYRPGRGTESAIHEFLTYTENSLSKGLINLSLFIDIDGAFDHVSINALLNGAKILNIESWTVEFLVHI